MAVAVLDAEASWSVCAWRWTLSGRVAHSGTAREGGARRAAGAARRAATATLRPNALSSSSHPAQFLQKSFCNNVEVSPTRWLHHRARRLPYLDDVLYRHDM